MDIIDLPVVEDVVVVSRFNRISHTEANSPADKDFSFGNMLKSSMKKSVSYASGLLGQQGMLPPNLKAAHKASKSTSKKNRPSLISPIRGKLVVTATHLIFSAERDANKADNEHSEHWILHCHIQSVQLLPASHFRIAETSTSRLGYPLKLRCKNFRAMTIIVFNELEARMLQAELSRLSMPHSLFELPCFSHIPEEEARGEVDRETGWTMIRLEKEFQRQGLPNKQWRMCDLNKGYRLCETYPEVLYVPAKANDEVLIGSAAFRSKRRLPVLTYFHSESGGVMCR